MNVDTFLARWGACREKSRQISMAINEDNESFRPTPEYRSIIEMYRHTLQAHECIVRGIPEGNFDWKGVELSVARVLRPEVEAQRDRLDVELEARLRSSNDAWFEEDAPGTGLSRDEWLWALIEHETHHRGQLSLMLRLAGTPPPRIFE